MRKQEPRLKSAAENAEESGMAHTSNLTDARRADAICKIERGLGSMILRNTRTEEELARGTHADLMALVVGYGLRIETHMMGRMVVSCPGGNR